MGFRLRGGCDLGKHRQDEADCQGAESGESNGKAGSRNQSICGQYHLELQDYSQESREGSNVEWVGEGR